MTYDSTIAAEVTKRAGEARSIYIHNDWKMKGQHWYDALDNLTNDLFYWEYEFHWMCVDDKREEAVAYLEGFIEDIRKMRNMFALPTMANGLNVHSPIATIDHELNMAGRSMSKILEQIKG